MGILRLLLAIAVVFTHTPLRTQLTGGELAVEAFFMISGFYVALVLDRNYSQAKYFYINRYLRLFPVYIFLALVSSISWIMFDVRPMLESAEGFAGLSPSAAVYMVFTNVTMLTQDVVMFVCDGGSGPYFSANFSSCKSPLYTYLLIPQAWSIGVEICFYLCAPFMLRLDVRHLLWLVIASMVLRFLIFFLGVRGDPWSYRFFPTELLLFLSGSIAYKLKYNMTILSDGQGFVLKIVSVIGFTIFFSALPFGRFFYVVYLGLLFVSLPALLKFSSNHVWDRKIGDLSYPLYLCHVLVIAWLMRLDTRYSPTLFSLMAASVSIVVAVILYFCIDVPMARIRSRWRIA